MSANILQACIDGVHYWRSPYNPESVQAHSGLHGSLLRAAHMPELRSGIVAALREKHVKFSVRASTTGNFPCLFSSLPAHFVSQVSP